MELDLRLAPPNYFVDKGFDLNGNALEENEGIMEGFIKDDILVKKRRFDEAFVKHNEVERKTSSLLLLNAQPNEVDEDKITSSNSKNSESGYGNVEEKGKIVNWSHINSWRKKFESEVEAGGSSWISTNEEITRSGKLINRRKDSMFVKVKMEGVAIARKVNLHLYNSYHHLKNDLLNMFTISNAYDNGRKFAILYQDKEGDWLIAGGVPWQTFMESVKRIEIVKMEFEMFK